MSKGPSFTPFPDLTGWRSSAAERGSSSNLISVSNDNTRIRRDVLEEAANRLQVVEIADLIIASWVIVLIHLLSQENEVNADILIDPLNHVHLHILAQEKKQISISSLLELIQTNKEAISESDNWAKWADNVVSIDLSTSFDAKKCSNSNLFFTTNRSAENKEDVQLTLQASPMVHNQSSAQMHLAQVVACLEYLCKASPSSPAFSMQHFPDQLLAGDNPLPSPLLDDISNSDLVHERFEHQMESIVEKFPDAIALDFRASLEAEPGDEKVDNVLWTYNELNRRARILEKQIRFSLSKHEGKADERTDIVALFLEKSPFTYLSILAVLKAGAAWCPIDTDWPAARQSALLAKSGARLVLTAGESISRTLSDVVPNAMTVVRIDEIDYTHIQNGTASIKVTPSRPSSELAYLIWTSGTTGLPKAVGIQHRAAVQALRSLQRVIPYNPNGFRYLQFSAYNFDLMILDVFYTWGKGGTLCSSSRSLLLTNLVDLCNTLQVSHTLLTPAVMAMTPRQSIPSLQVVINGGEKLSQVVADMWSVDCCLLNLYGPAEATLIAMSRRVPQGDQVKAPNIGRALPSTSCHALDSSDEIILKGAVGQLVIGGHQCAVGYIGETDKTRDKFVEHPMLGRIYKTGDLVRQLWNGDFEYLGRSDDQIKVNGIRIELLEINAIMRSALDQVKDSETLLIKSKTNDEEEDDVQIINFSVAPLESEVGSSIIRIDNEAVELSRRLTDYASVNLPSYMTPSLFIIVSSFPRTSSAKIDREALRIELEQFDRLEWLNRLAGSQETVTEQLLSPEEEKIRHHLAPLCGITPSAIGRHTHFPSLGLNSIKAITLSHRLQKAGVIATVVDIVVYNTLATLAQHLESSPSKEATRIQTIRAYLELFDQQHRPAVESFFRDRDAPCSTRIEKVLPVTGLQEVLLSETIHDRSRYWLHRAYSLPLGVDIKSLDEAIRTVIRGTDILRTCFLNRGQLEKEAQARESFVQTVLSHSKVQIAVVEDVASENLDERIMRLVEKELSLEAIGLRPPLGFLIVNGREPKLVAVMHHALYDQVSLRLIEDAIVACYEDCSKDLFPFTSFSLALEHLVVSSNEEERQHRQTWDALLSKYPKGHAVSFPNISGRDTTSNDATTSRYSRRTDVSFERAAKAARDLQTSIRPILQAAWASVLSAHCDTSHILLGDSVSGRTASAGLDRIVGPILDTLPIPICIDATYKEVITTLDDFHKQAIASQPVPLRSIRAIVQIPHDCPLFTSVFVFEPPEEEQDISSTQPTSHLLEDHRDFAISVEHSLAVEVTITSDGHLTLGITARDAILSADYADLLLSQWESALCQAIEDPHSLTTDFCSPHFSDNHLSISRCIIPETLESARKIPVFSALNKWARKTPNAVAVELRSSLQQTSNHCRTMTYKELEQASQKVAHLLRDKIPLHSVVAVCLHRSIETYIVLLAILRAGMTYLPIDATLPARRKSSLLTESSAACLVWSSSTQWSLHDQAASLAIVDMESIPREDYTISSHYSELDINMPSPAFIIFTSGSTGTPKGCLLTHENLSSAIEAFRLTFEREAAGTLDQTTRFFARSVEAFDVALLEALLPLQVGGTIVTGPREVILKDVGAAMKVMQVTHAAVVPSLFYTEGRRVIPSDLPQLRALIVGGERMAEDIIQEWAPSQVPLLNAYGPTEACIGTSIARLYLSDSTSVIGVPFPGTQYLILKESSRGQLRNTLRGEAGELCIAGLQVGSYLPQVDSTSFTTWQGQRIYRTGDEARLRKGNVTEYLGRASNGQVKIRGVRIELSEIDNVLVKSAKLNRFCTTRTIGQPPYLVTFVAPDASSQMAEEELKVAMDPPLQEEASNILRLAKEKLPLYMIPRIIVSLAWIPLSGISGKIDGKRLEAWYMDHAATLLESSSLETTQNNKRKLDDRECIVKEEIEKLHKIEAHIGPLTDVFALGLDSISVISLSTNLCKRGIQVDVAYIMTNSTVEAIARVSKADSQAVSQEDHFDYTEQARRVTKLNITEAYPLLPLQESMIIQTLANGIESGSRYINVIRLACKSKDIDRGLLEGSLEDALSSHHIYRTIFVEVHGKFLQAVLVDTPSLRMEEADFEKVAVGQISSTLDSVPPLRYCVTDSKEILIAIHHALYDGDSLDDLLKEVQERYNGKTPNSKGHFVEYVKEVHGRSMESKLDFWENKLADSTVTFLPCLSGKKMPQQFSSTSRQFLEHRSTLSLASLQQRARNNKITLPLLVMDAFARLYSNYVAQEHIIFGLVLGGRSGNHRQVHGPCINTVPFSHSVGSSTWQKQIQTSFAEALSNQHISLPGLGRRMQVQGTLFNTLFSYLGVEKSSDFFYEVSSQLVIEYPFAIEVQELPQHDGIALRAVFDSNHFPTEQTLLFLKQLEDLLSSDQSATQFNSQLLAIENEKPFIPDTSLSFLERFHRQVLQQPDAVAFVFSHDFQLSNEETTYRQLDQKSSIIANELINISGNVIGVLLKQCPDLYSLLIAIWKVGKVYLPLDPSLPVERLEYMVSIAKPALIVAGQSDVQLAKRLGKSSNVEDLLHGQQMAFKRVKEVALNKPAYIMFTSGSTGKPKGVQISHMALAAAIYSWSQILPHSSTSRMLQLASPGFDVFLIEVCMPLALGFSFASASKEDLLNDLEETFSKLQLTMADLPAVLAATVRPDNIANKHKLEWLMSGGDLIEDRVIQQWSSRGLINAWGPTETTIGNTLGFVSEESSRSWVGRAYPTSSIYILEPGSTDVAFRGCIGEIAVGGPQVADGYIDNEALTREKFVLLSNGARVYRTGDRGRLLSDGSLECLGRMNTGQIKINSQRVEMGEIELQLKRHGEVLDALVLYLKHAEMQSKQLIAFVVVKGGGQESKEVRFCEGAEAKKHAISCLEEAKEHLAGYMIPSLCLVVAGKSLPLTPNNKIDAKRLESMFLRLTAKEIRKLDVHSSSQGERKAWTEQESKLRTIIADFCELNENEVERDVSFYRLGIDSVSGFRLIKRLREGGFSQLSLQDLLRAPTVASLASLIEEQKNGKQESDIDLVIRLDERLRKHCDTSSLGLSPKDRIKRLLPCTPLQQGLLIESLNSGLYIHHNFFLVEESKLSSVVDAVFELVRSHDILRTSFHLVDGDFVQAVHTDIGLDMEDVIKISEMQKAIEDLATSKIFIDETDIARPLFRVNRLRSEKQGIVVIDLVLHHALYDGESLEMLFADIETRVNGYQVPIRKDFEQLLPHLLSRPEDENFIVDQIGDCPSTLLGRTSTSVSARSSCSSFRSLEIDMQTLANSASKAGVSIHILALFSFSKLLSHLTQQRDVVFAQLFSLRDAIQGAEDMIGPALNSTLTRTTLFNEETTLDAISRLQRDMDAARTHRRASMAQVLRLIKNKRGVQSIEFDALFDFQRSGERDETKEVPKSKVLTPWDKQEESSTQYALNVQFRQQGSSISVVAVGDAEIFSQLELDKHLETLEEILTLIIKDFDSPSTEMPSGLTDLNALPSATVVRPIANETKLSRQRQISLRNLTREEQIVLGVIVELMQTDEESIDLATPINQLGLDSIAAIRLASLLRSKGIAVGVADILQGKTVEGISHRIAEKKKVTSNGKHHPVANGQQAALQNTKDAAQALGISTEQVEAVLPLLPGQEFELAEYLHSKGKSGIFSFLYKIQSHSVDESRMERVWSRLRVRHSILRTSFLIDEGEVRQVVLSSVSDSSWQTRQLEGKLTSLLSDPKVWNVWLDDACNVDSTLRRPPCAACLIVTSDGCYLVLRLHHVLYDAWTISILVHDLWQLYQEDQRDTNVIQNDHIRLVEHVSSEKNALSDRAEKYWKALMKDVSPCLLGDKSPRLKTSKVTISLPDILCDVSKFEKKLQPLHVSFGTAFIAAWSKCLLRLFEPQRKVVFGLYHRGRSSEFDGVERVASNCMNVLPLVLNRDDNSNMIELCHSIRDQMDEQALYESSTSISDILSWTQDGQIPWNSYLNLVFDHDEHQTEDQMRHLDPLPIPEYEQKEGESDWESFWKDAKLSDMRSDININIYRNRSKDSIDVAFHYQEGIWSSEKVQHIIQELTTHLQGIVGP